MQVRILSIKQRSSQKSVVRILLPLIFGSLLIQRCVGVVQPYRLHTVALPLVGAPKFLKLHRAAVFEPLIEKSFSQPIRSECTVVVLDFLPLKPTEPQTLSKLLALHSVEGEIRLSKPRLWPRNGVRVGKAVEVSVDLDEFVANLRATFNTDLHLLTNNCATFVTLAEQTARNHRSRD